MRSLKLPLSPAEFEELLTMFTRLEFNWSLSETDRSYFFNKGCVMQFLLDTMGISLSVHTLKDAERVKYQMKAMRTLL